MIEKILLCLYTLPSAGWLAVSIVSDARTREPVSLSVNEMLVLFVSFGIIACSLCLVNPYKISKNGGIKYVLAYGFLIIIGSFFTALILFSQFLSMSIEMNKLHILLALIVFILTPLIGIVIVWRRV